MTNMYRFVIMLDDFKVNEFFKSFDNDTDLRHYVVNYLDGNNEYTIKVYNSSNKKIHSFEYAIGSHNRMRLYDQILVEQFKICYLRL